MARGWASSRLGLHRRGEWGRGPQSQHSSMASPPPPGLGCSKGLEPQGANPQQQIPHLLQTLWSSFLGRMEVGDARNEHLDSSATDTPVLRAHIAIRKRHRHCESPVPLLEDNETSSAAHYLLGCYILGEFDCQMASEALRGSICMQAWVLFLAQGCRE